MRILLAAPDRDLLGCYKKLLESDLGETVTSFDGTQVLSLIQSESFDIAVIDSDLPRIEYGKLIAQIKDKRIKTVALINEPVSARKAKKEPSADAYLQYPFDYCRIRSVITKTLCDNEKG